MIPRLASTLLLSLPLALVLLAGACGGSEAAPEPDADLGPREFTIVNMDDSGQSHSLTIACADLLSEEPITLLTDGAHQHSIRLEVVDLVAIAAGDPVTITFTEGHEHSFTIVKPPEACLP